MIKQKETTTLMLKLASFPQQAELISRVTKEMVQTGSKLKLYLFGILNEKHTALTLYIPFYSPPPLFCFSIKGVSSAEPIC